MGNGKNNELTVITKTKNLCFYVLTITDKSPKKFRFTLVAKLQNNALDALERNPVPCCRKSSRTHAISDTDATDVFVFSGSLFCPLDQIALPGGSLGYYNV